MNSFAACLGRLAACLSLVLSASLVYAEGSGPTPEALEKARIANAKCLECHAEDALMNPPLGLLDQEKLSEVVLDPGSYKGSVHGRLACTRCHTDGYTDYPHAANAKESTSVCSDCHSKKTRNIEPEFEKSVHAKHLKSTFTCLNCHDPHVMRVAANLVDPAKIVDQDNRVCLGCHDSDERFAKFAPARKTRPAIDEIHSWLPNTRLHWKHVRCVECHTPLSKEDRLSHEIVNKSKAEKRCVNCHNADSTLKARLYRHLASEEHQKYGFLNSVFLGTSYVVGATRNQVLDTIVIALVIITLIGSLVHGLLRIIAARLRRSKQHD